MTGSPSTATRRPGARRDDYLGQPRTHLRRCRDAARRRRVARTESIGAFQAWISAPCRRPAQRDLGGDAAFRKQHSGPRLPVDRLGLVDRKAGMAGAALGRGDKLVGDAEARRRRQCLAQEIGFVRMHRRQIEAADDGQATSP